MHLQKEKMVNGSIRILINAVCGISIWQKLLNCTVVSGPSNKREKEISILPVRKS